MNRAEAGLAREIAALGPWFHNLRIGGIETAPDHPLGDYPRCKWERFAHVLPDDLAGASVLDVGCNAGFYSLEMARRGAGEVIGIDSDPRYLRQAALAAAAAGEAGRRISFRRMDVYEVADLGRRFDLVIFMGVLYHLRHPLLALDLLHEHVVGDRLLFQSMLRGAEGAAEPTADYPFGELAIFGRPDWPRLHFVEHRYAGDPTNWFIPNAACAEALLRSAGFEILDRPEREVWLAARAARPSWVPAPPAVAGSAGG